MTLPSPITAGALLGHEDLGKGTVLSLKGAFALVYFPDYDETPDGPRWIVDLAAGKTRLEEPSADQPEEPDIFAPYVVELRERAALPVPRAPGRPFVYVGISRHSQSRRFTTHKSGSMTAADVVAKHGLYLRPNLYRRYERVVGEDAADALERTVAADLSADGFGVAVGFGFPWANLRRRSTLPG